MKSLKSTLIVLGASAAITAGAYAASAAPQDSSVPSTHMHHHEMGMEHGMGEMPFMGVLKDLNLSQEQHDSVKKILDGVRPQRDSLRDEARANMQSLISVTPDDPKYAQLVEAQKQLAAKGIQLHSDVYVQIYKLLTPEQKAKLPQMLADRRARVEARREQWKQNQSKPAEPAAQ